MKTGSLDGGANPWVFESADDALNDVKGLLITSEVQ